MDRGYGPRSLARLAGVCQVLEAVTATWGQVFVFSRFIVSGNAAATAANILGHEARFWQGFASSLLGVVFHLAWALLMYELLKPVSRRLSLFALVVIVVGCAVQALTCVFYLAPMVVLRAGAPDMLAYAFAELNGGTFNTYLVFFGLWCALIGVLIVRSTFMPRILGVLVGISGLGWLLFLVPPIATRLFSPYIVVASAIGEIPLELWLIVMAVNAQKWTALATGRASSSA